MLNLMLPIALVVAAVVAASSYTASVSSCTDRIDCPGKIICPLTGELVCEDQCPMGLDAPRTNRSANPDANTIVNSIENPSCCQGKLVETSAVRPNCPGKIVCPLTGELVCEDRCPLGERQTKAQAAAQSCCKTLN